MQSRHGFEQLVDALLEHICPIPMGHRRDEYGALRLIADHLHNKRSMFWVALEHFDRDRALVRVSSLLHDHIPTILILCEDAMNGLSRGTQIDNFLRIKTFYNEMKAYSRALSQVYPSEEAQTMEEKRLAIFAYFVKHHSDVFWNVLVAEAAKSPPTHIVSMLKPTIASLFAREPHQKELCIEAIQQNIHNLCYSMDIRDLQVLCFNATLGEQAHVGADDLKAFEPVAHP